MIAHSVSVFQNVPLLCEKPPLLRDYARFHIRIAEKALSGALRGDDAASISALERTLEIWKDVEKWL